MKDTDPKTLIRRKTILALVSDTSGGRMARLDRVLEAAAADSALMEVLAPAEFYFLMRDIGNLDAAPLLTYATDEQLGKLVDFDAWAGYEFSPERFTAWQDLALSESPEVASRLVKAVDPDVISLQILRLARVLEVDGTPEQTDVYGGRDEVFQSPDNKFWLICLDAVQVPAVKRLVDLLYMTNLEWARELLKASAWELVSSLEDEALRFRTARLEEEGFPSPEEALRVYQAIDPERIRALLDEHDDPVRIQRPPVESQALWVLGSRGIRESPLTRALASMRDGPRKTAIVQSLAYLLGELFMADTRGDLNKADAAAQAPARLHGLVSAGLEDLAGPNPEDAAALLRRIHPRLLFRAGFTLLLGVRGRARDCLRRAGATQGFRLLDDPPFGLAIEAAASFVPQIHQVLDAPGETTTREIRGLSDLQTLRDLVHDAAARLDFVIETLGASPDDLQGWVGEEASGHVTCVTLTATALLDSLLDLPPVTPLTPLQVLAALDLWMPWDQAAGRRVPVESIQGALLRRMEEEAPAVRGLFEDSMARIRATFEGIPPETLPDSRFLGATVLIGMA